VKKAHLMGKVPQRVKRDCQKEKRVHQMVKKEHQ